MSLLSIFSILEIIHWIFPTITFEVLHALTISRGILKWFILSNICISWKHNNLDVNLKEIWTHFYDFMYYKVLIFFLTGDT